ncbi:MAG TPA: PP2C family protein-serine/threonine phosphatase [Actinoplanes sp.]|nr:PP2C family protein-serine/threonine phosphatase [Actinoplanes sp.]
MSESSSVGVLLRSAAPDQLAEVLAAHLRRQHDALQVEVLLGDYPHSRLCPVIEDSAPVDAGPAGRCFGSQGPVVDRRPGRNTRTYLPLSAWGERLGVLLVETAPERTDHTEVLQGAADEFATALQAAGRDTDRYRRVRRRQRLTMAAELQWDLLPGHSLGDERFLIAGALEPSYAICGDHFDWSLDGDRLTVTVLNGHGDGLDAALLTTVAVTAMRNARRCGADLLEQAELAGEAVASKYGGDRHVETLLLAIGLVDGTVEAVDAGSPRAMIIGTGDVRPVELEQQLPIGMFGDTRYALQHFQLAPGDRLLVVTDGVHAAAPGGRAPFGERGLIAAIRRTRLQPATEAVGTVLRGLREYHAGMDPTDDAVTVCLDWRRPAHTTR